jgi:phosphatidyl-myo-inositol alpha-mannosyltransferase
VVVQHLGRDAVVIPNGIRFDDFARGPHLRTELVEVHPSTGSGRAAGGSGRAAGGSGRTAGSPMPAQQPRLIFIGRLDEPRKGLDVLLAAIPQIREARPDLEVIVAGQGSRPLPSCCRSLGTISDQTKIALLNTADVFVAPQLARESFGIVLLEAMASGVQIVASDLPSFVDVLGGPHDESRLGEVFTVGDYRALAGAVLHVLDHPSPLRAARAQQAARHYDWSSVGPAVLAVYRATLSAAPRQTGKVIG